MEFHDILHGLIRIEGKDIAEFVEELINTPELQRLRNMRQMNFDVPLIQELGRSRRFPHSIGVAHIALRLAYKSKLAAKETKTVVAAALIHDAAIPPYGHLVESEFKQLDEGFSHESILEKIIYGAVTDREMVPGRFLGVKLILDEHDVDPKAVMKLVSPRPGRKTPISADLDIDNIDNIHRMAAMLGWPGAKENTKHLIDSAYLNGMDEIQFSGDAEILITKWLEYRERIYTLIIAHPECIANNALQAHLVRLAVKHSIVTPDEWHITELEFEHKLFYSEKTSSIARQLVSGCEYTLLDYVWFKDFSTNEKLTNYKIAEAATRQVKIPIRSGKPKAGDNKREMTASTVLGRDNIDFLQKSRDGEILTGYFVWDERGLITREISWIDTTGERHVTGRSSRSCMIAAVKKTRGGKGGCWDKSCAVEWRRDIIQFFRSMAKTGDFEVSYPEDYTGRYTSFGSGELKFNF